MILGRNLISTTIKIQFGLAMDMQSSGRATKSPWREMRLLHKSVCKWHSVTLQRNLMRAAEKAQSSTRSSFSLLPAPLIAICGLGAFATLFLQRLFFCSAEAIYLEASCGEFNDWLWEKEMQPESQPASDTLMRLAVNRFPSASREKEEASDAPAICWQATFGLTTPAISRKNHTRLTRERFERIQLTAFCVECSMWSHFWSCNYYFESGRVKIPHWSLSKYNYFFLFALANFDRKLQ